MCVRECVRACVFSFLLCFTKVALSGNIHPPPPYTVLREASCARTDILIIIRMTQLDECPDIKVTGCDRQ